MSDGLVVHDQVPGNAELALLLIDLWEELDSLVALADDRTSLHPAPVWATEMRSALKGELASDVLRRWRMVFADELNIVRSARNAVAHAFHLSDDNLRDAVYVAARLLLYARMSAGQEEFSDSRIATGLALRPYEDDSPPS